MLSFTQHMSLAAALALLSPQTITARPLLAARGGPEQLFVPSFVADHHVPADIFDKDFLSGKFPPYFRLPEKIGFSHSFPSECPDVDWSHGVGIDWDGVMQMEVF